MKKLILISAIALSGCGTSSKNIQASYISPLEYQDYSCKQIRAEVARVSRRANSLAGDIDKNAEGDKVAMGAGLILFWPALFFIDGDHPNQAEYGELRGRMNALEEVAVKKNCGIDFTPPPPPPTAEPEKKKKNWN